MSLTSFQVLQRTKITRALLQAMTTHSMVIVSAPMGYGKTTTAREVHKSEKVNSVFFSIPANSDNASLWDELWKSMETQGLEQSTELRRLGFPNTPATELDELKFIDSFHLYGFSLSGERMSALSRS